MANVADRYARAIFDHLKNADKTRAFLGELEQFKATVTNSKELQSVLFSEVIAAKDRRAITEDIVAKLKLSDTARKVLVVLSERMRLPFVGAVAERLKARLLNSLGRVALTVESVRDLDADEKKKIETKFAKLFGREVEATYRLQKELIGGIRVTAAERTYEGSLAGWLSTLGERLVAGGSVA